MFEVPHLVIHFEKESGEVFGLVLDPGELFGYVDHLRIIKL